MNWNAPSFRNASEINSTSIVVHFDDYPRIDWNAPSMHFVVKWKELEPVTEEEVFLLNINLIFWCFLFHSSGVFLVQSFSKKSLHKIHNLYIINWTTTFSLPVQQHCQCYKQWILMEWYWVCAHLPSVDGTEEVCQLQHLADDTQWNWNINQFHRDYLCYTRRWCDIFFLFTFFLKY